MMGKGGKTIAVVISLYLIARLNFRGGACELNKCDDFCFGVVSGEEEQDGGSTSQAG